MEASELADKLEKLEAVGHMNTMDTTMFLNRNLILKSLRFAADMEKLTSVATVRFQVTRTQEVACICSMWNDNREIRGEGSDIYAAARKAVEALEGGK